MADRIVDLSDEPARVSCSNGSLVLERRDVPEVHVPLRDVAVVVLSHPQISITQPALSALAAAGAMLITCDAARLPVGMQFPLQGNFVQTERMAAQIAASAPMKKRVWRDLVVAKVRSQGAALHSLHGSDGDLFVLANQVRSGDPANIEARAARRYWPLLFADASFRRDQDAADANRFLNYGYAVLRAILTRAICAAGLHPSIGVHHKNRFNAFALADDVIEPFRPMVDLLVVDLVSSIGADAPLDKHAKGAIIGALMGRFPLEGEQRTLFDISGRTAGSLNAIFAGESTKLVLPDFEEIFAMWRDQESTSMKE